MMICVLPWLACSLLVSHGAAVNLSGVESALEASLQSTKTYFLTRLNETVTDIVDKGITDVKSLASQGFQALVLNYMNDLAKEKAKDKSTRTASSVLKSHVDLMDTVISLLEISGTDLKSENTILVETFDDLTSDLGNLTIETKDAIKTVVESHGEYLQTFILSGLASLRHRISNLHLDQKTDLCSTCFNQTLRYVPGGLSPMINGLRTMMRLAGSVMTQVVNILITGGSLSHTTVDRIENLLKLESNKLTEARVKVFKELDGCTVRSSYQNE